MTELPWPRALFLFVLGACVGSFLNVVIYRVPRGLRPWSPPRSFCPACRTTLRWYENLPLVSYLWLRGRCRSCGMPISLRYPVVEALGGLLAWGAAVRFPWGVPAVEAFFFGALLLALAWIDLETYRLPDEIVAVGAAFGVGFAALEAAQAGSWRPLLLRIGVGLGSLLTLALVRVVGSQLAGREAMGRGDVTFFGMIGLYLGDPVAQLVALVLAALLGAVVGSLLLLLTRGRFRQIPFGPFLSLASWVVYFFGAPVVRAYFTLLEWVSTPFR